MTFVVLKRLMYFDEPQGDDTRSSLLSVGSPLVNRFEGGCQAKSVPKDPHEKGTKNTVYPAQIWVTRIHPWSQAWG